MRRIRIRHETDPAPHGIPSPLHALVVCAAALAAMLASGLLIGLFATSAAIAAGHSVEELKANPRALPTFSSPFWIAAGTLANESAVAVTLWVALGWLKPSRDRVLPLKRPASSSIFAALLIVLGAAPLADAAAELCHRWVGSDLTATELVATAARGASPGGLALLIFALAVVPALVEESMFRGFVTAAFAKSQLSAFLVPTLLFGAFHLEPTQAAGTVVLGAGFALARLWTGSLVPGIIVHAVYNTAVIFAVRYGDVPLPGKPIEPLPIVVGLGVSAAGVALLARARRVSEDSSLPADLS